MIARPLASPVAGTIITAAGGGDAPANALQIGQTPSSVAVFGSTVYVSDGQRNVVWALNTSTGVESAVAGTGVAGYSGDGGAATAATLNNPFGVAVDSSGNLYIADSGNNVIRKVSTSGVISTIAGTGVSGYTGNGGAATAAKLSAPYAVAVTSSGIVYIADTGNKALRKVTTAGTISTVAGDTACTAPHGLHGIGGVATSAELCSPTAVAIKGSNVLIADSGNSVVDQLTGANLLLFAGNGKSGSTGDGGSATAAELETPAGLTVDGSGNVFIADSTPSVIREVASAGTISTVAGTSGSTDVTYDPYADPPYVYPGGLSGGSAATTTTLDAPTGVAVTTAGTVYFADADHYEVGQFTVGGNVTVVAGDGTPDAGNTGDGSAATTGEVSPGPLAATSAGELFTGSESFHNITGSVRYFTATGSLATEWSGNAIFLALGAAANRTTFYGDDYNLYEIPPAGNPQDIRANYFSEQPGGVVVDGSGDAYASNGAIGAFTPAGAYTGQVGSGRFGVALDSAGNIWSLADSYGSPPNYPIQLSLYETGRNGGATQLVAANLPTAGIEATGNTPYSPSLAVDRAGDVFFVDGNHYVYERRADGTIITIAGTGVSTVPGAADGDGGPATAATTDADFLALDTAGDLFLTDGGRIREIVGASSYGGSFPKSGPIGVANTEPANGLGSTEAYGPTNASEACLCGHAQATSNPVDTESGDFWHTFTDLSTTGRGPSLSLTRTYESANASTDGLFGHGWSSTYGMSLASDSGTGDVIVTQENGDTVLFVPGGSGTFTPAQPRELAALVQNSNGTYTFTRRHRQIFTFSATGQLTALTDLHGYATTLGYDTSGHLLSVTDPAGRVYTVTTTNGRVTKVVDPDGRTASYTYSSVGDLLTATDPTSAVWTYTYDPGHLLLTMLDPRQTTSNTPSPLTNAYDSQGRVLTQTDYLGRKTTFDYTSISGATKVTDPAGDVTVDYYSSGGLLTSSTVGYGTTAAATTSFTYDPTTEARASVTDPLNHKTSYTYNSSGDELTMTDPLMQKTTYTYDGLDDVLTATDPIGTVTMNTYTADGDLKTTSTPLIVNGSTTATRTTTYSYGNTTYPGDVTAVTDPDGHTTNLTYDAFGDLTASTAPPTPENSTGDKTTYTYDTNTGWRLTMVSPKGNLSGATAANYTTTYSYDNDGRQTLVRSSEWTASLPKDHQTAATYDLDGNLGTRTDGDGNTTTYTYDADNELTATAQPNGVTTHQSWTFDGELLTTTDGNSNVTTYGYDPRNDRLTTQDPLGRVTTDTYDLAGNLTLETAPGASCGSTPTTGCTSLTYSFDNQLLTRSYLDGVTPGVSNITYDADSRRTGQTDTTGTSTWVYDTLGRLTSTTDGTGTVTAYTYDLVGNLLTLTYPGTAHTVIRTYDALNRLATVSDWSSNKTTAAYDADSNLTGEIFPTSTGETDTYAYDQLDQLTTTTMKHGSTTLASFAYTHDTNDQLAGSTTTGITDPTQTFGYNAINELSASGSASTPTTYGYDAGKNLTNRGTTSGGTASTQAFDKADQLCWSTTTTVTSPTCGTVPTGATTYTYNSSGDRTAAKTGSSPVATYAYNETQQLTTSTNSAGTATTYTYDGDGLRLTKTTTGVSTHFVWDHAGAQPMALSDSTYYFIYGPGNHPLAQIAISGGTITYLHHDQIGTTRLLTSNTGAIVGEQSYDPYGNRAAHSGSITSPLGFLGEYIDSESALIYLRSRYYDRGTGEFLTVDPALPVTQSPYAYTLNDPLNGIDPTGLSPLSWLIDNAGDISAASGTAAVLIAFVPGLDALSPVLGVISVATGALATGNDIAAGNYGQAALDGVATVAGGAGLVGDLGSSLLQVSARQAWDDGEPVLAFAQESSQWEDTGGTLDRVAGGLAIAGSVTVHAGLFDSAETGGC